MSATKNFYFDEICNGMQEAQNHTNLTNLKNKSKELMNQFMSSETDVDIQKLNVEATILKNQFRTLLK